MGMIALIGGFHLLLTEVGGTSWWEHVDSRANPSDGGTRIGTECGIAAKLGFQMEELPFPQWPSDMLSLRPTDWLSLFRKECR